MNEAIIPLNLAELQAARNGDEEARLSLYRVVEVVSRRAARHNRLPKEDIQDIRHSAFVDTMQCLAGLPALPTEVDRSAFVQCLARSAERHAKAARRRYDREVASATMDETLLREDISNDIDMPGTEQQYASSVVSLLRPLIEVAIASISERDRNLIRSCYFNYATAAEVQESFHIPSREAVYTAMYRARRTFGAALLEAIGARMQDPQASPQEASALRDVHNRLATPMPKGLDGGDGK